MNKTQKSKNGKQTRQRAAREATAH